MGEPQAKLNEKSTGGTKDRILIKKIFIEIVLWDVVLHPDSEYHIRFVSKLIFVGHSLEIPGHFMTFLLFF